MGFFADLFGDSSANTPKSLDQETREQLTRAATKFAAAGVPAVDDVMTDILAAELKRRQRYLIPELVIGFTRQLVIAAELYSPPPPATALAVAETDLAAGVKLRALLARKEKLLDSYAVHDVIARLIIGGAVRFLLDVLPEPLEDEEGATTFQVSLAGVLKDPPAFFTDLLRHFFSGPMQGKETLLFHEFRGNLLKNALATTPDKATDVPVIFPSHHKERDPETLFDIYFRGTHLAGLLGARLRGFRGKGLRPSARDVAHRATPTQKFRLGTRENAGKDIPGPPQGPTN